MSLHINIQQGSVLSQLNLCMAVSTDVDQCVHNSPWLLTACITNIHPPILFDSIHQSADFLPAPTVISVNLKNFHTVLQKPVNNTVKI